MCACTAVCSNRSSLWIKAFYNPLSRHNSTSLTMDLCLLCLLIIVLILVISCFMIPLAFFLSRRASATVMFNFCACGIATFFLFFVIYTCIHMSDIHSPCLNPQEADLWEERLRWVRCGLPAKGKYLAYNSKDRSIIVKIVAF